ncbi:hypothetical protein [Alkalibacillus salilacus]|uniref:Uncharacterized protein n=1 Tax=Alkalibacillus salilacus TaxID=284582 RepID=A0ABT9VDR0_9BACI|nr:hypothetical protein [Alkalibacillus salilacus]MDQ0158990.1 hypothetical protein [Alkalibacillus salilacus]
MTVFKMNEIDTVVANSEEEAKAFYKDFVDVNEEELHEDFVGEVSLEKRMYVGLEMLTEEEKTQAREWINFEGEMLTPMTYKEVMQRKNQEAPYIISSTDW